MSKFQHQYRVKVNASNSVRDRKERPAFDLWEMVSLLYTVNTEDLSRMKQAVTGYKFDRRVYEDTTFCGFQRVFPVYKLHDL
jgi:hypothetical protein